MIDDESSHGRRSRGDTPMMRMIRSWMVGLRSGRLHFGAGAALALAGLMVAGQAATVLGQENDHFFDPANAKRFREAAGLAAGPQKIQDSITNHSKYSNLDWGVPLTPEEAIELDRRSDLQLRSDKAIDYAIAQPDYGGMHWDQRRDGIGVFKFTGHLEKHREALAARLPEKQAFEVTKSDVTLKELEALAGRIFRRR